MLQRSGTHRYQVVASVVLCGTDVKRDDDDHGIAAKRTPGRRRQTAVRARILDAAFAAFMKSGYAATSTLEIATRARVSKRELYALVGNKQEMLIACISARATRLQVPDDLPVPHDRETLAHVLASFATQLVREITDPTVIAVFRLAIAEAVHAPEVAQALDSHRARGESRRLAPNHGAGSGIGTSQRSSCRTGRTVRRIAMGQFDDQPAARRRQAAQFTRTRRPCPRCHGGVSATDRLIGSLPPPRGFEARRFLPRRRRQ